MTLTFLEIVKSIKYNEEQGIYFTGEELDDIYSITLDTLLELCDFYEYDYFPTLHSYAYYIDVDNITIHII